MNDAVTCPENKIDPTTDALIGNRTLSCFPPLVSLLAKYTCTKKKRKKNPCKLRTFFFSKQNV